MSNMLVHYVLLFILLQAYCLFSRFYRLFVFHKITFYVKLCIIVFPAVVFVLLQVWLIHVLSATHC